MLSINYMYQEKEEGRILALKKEYMHQHKDSRDASKRAKTNYSSQLQYLVTQKKTTKTRKQKWKDKQMYGLFEHKTRELAHEKNWALIPNGNLIRETKSFFIVAQNYNIRTNYIDYAIE